MSEPTDTDTETSSGSVSEAEASGSGESELETTLRRKPQTQKTITSGAEPQAAIRKGVEPGTTLASEIEPGTTITSEVELEASIRRAAECRATARRGAEPRRTITSEVEPRASVRRAAEPQATIATEVEPQTIITSEIEAQATFRKPVAHRATTRRAAEPQITTRRGVEPRTAVRTGAETPATSRRRAEGIPDRRLYHNNSASGQATLYNGDITHNTNNQYYYNNTNNQSNTNYAGSSGAHGLTSAALLGAASYSVINWAVSRLSNPETNRMFPSYRNQDKAFFVVGRVFEVLWTQAEGVTPEYIPRYESAESRGPDGQKTFSQTQLFVVTRQGHDISTCVPILTYGPDGASKPGIVKSNHSIVYTGRYPPNPNPRELPQRGEEGLRPAPIQIFINYGDPGLDETWRIDYNSIYSVMHTKKVKPFGIVMETSMNAFKYQFGKVWISNLHEANPD